MIPLIRPFIRPLKIFLLFTLLTGVVYPLFVTGVSFLLFPGKAGGSFIYNGNKAIGSQLIGQQFDDSLYFTSRPSATGYNPLPSGGSNFGLTNKKLKEEVEKRKEHFLEFNGLDPGTDIPSEMLFASASGLDPDISLNAALLQVNRIAKARHFDDARKQKLIKLINNDLEHPQFGILGKERINVLSLNLDLDKLK